MDAAAAPAFALDAFALDDVLVEPAALRLTSRHGSSCVEPKVMALLVALASRPGELRLRGELIDQLWPRGEGGDESLSRLVSLLRKSFTRDHGCTDVVATVPKLGYRLDGAVRPAPAPPAPSADSAPEESLAAADSPAIRRSIAAYALIAAIIVAGLAAAGYLVFERTGYAASAVQREADAPVSLAVLPIENLDPGGDSAFLADGMTRDLTAQLSRVPGTRVAPYSSTRALAAGSSDAASMAAELGVRYLVSGSLTRLGDRVILRVDLTDADTRSQIWSRRFGRSLDDFYAIQDRVVRGIATSVFSEVEASQIADVRDREPFNLNAYELVQKAEAERYGYGRAPALRIVGFARRALAIDPRSHRARTLLAYQLILNVFSGYSNAPAGDVAEARALLRQLRETHPRDPKVLATAAVEKLYLESDWDEARRLFYDALAIDPNDADSASVLGGLECYSGNTEKGLALIRDAEARAPQDRRAGLWAWRRMACELVEGDIDGALSANEEAIARNPNYAGFYWSEAVIQCLRNDGEAARRAAHQAREIDPDYDFERYIYIMDRVRWPGTPTMTAGQINRQTRACLSA